MRKNSLGKKIVAMATTVILAAAMAVPAFAVAPTEAAPTDPAKGAGLTTMGFSKTVEANADTYQPDLTFNFTVVSSEAGTYTYKDQDGKDVTETVYAGQGTSTIGSISTDKSKLGTAIYTGSINLPDVSSYTQPGIYHYLVKETAGTNNHTTYDATTKDLYVYVQRKADSSLEIYGAALVDADGNKTDTFTNTYKYNNQTDKDEFKDLTVTKAVTGGQGDKGKAFSFHITLNSADGRMSYKAILADGSSATLTAGTPYDFTLTDGQNLKVENLAENDTYTVTEDAVANYVTTATLKNSTADAATYTLATTTTMNRADNAIVVTNERNAATPTGIVMNIAPYVIMLLGALCAAFIFFKKKKVEE